MEKLFSDVPEAIAETAELSARLNFTLADLGYEFPKYPVGPGETMNSFLRQRTDEGARQRFRPYHEKARRQIERELALIEKLDLAGYFLIVWDLVRFLPQRENSGARARLGRQQRGVLFAGDHGGGSGGDGAAVRALSIGGTRRDGPTSISICLRAISASA